MRLCIEWLHPPRNAEGAALRSNVAALSEAHDGCCIIIPFSTVTPDPIEPHHVRIPADKYSFFRPSEDTWAKADMLAHVSFDRLDRVLDHGRYASPSISPDDFEAIRTAMLHAIGMSHILNPIAAATEVVRKVLEIKDEKRSIV